MPAARIEKALHEAKLHSSWLSPDQEYDQAVATFVRGILADRESPFVKELEDFVRSIAGAALFLAPAWNGAVVGFRIRVTPDRLQGRVHAVEALLSFGARPFAMLATGFLLDGLGGRSTLGIIAAYTIGIALLSTASPALRQMPPQEGTGAARAPIAATATADRPSAER